MERENSKLTREEAESRLALGCAQAIFEVGIAIRGGEIPKITACLMNHYIGHARTLELRFPGIRKPYDNQIKHVIPDAYLESCF